MHEIRKKFVIKKWIAFYKYFVSSSIVSFTITLDVIASPIKFKNINNGETHEINLRQFSCVPAYKLYLQSLKAEVEGNFTLAAITFYAARFRYHYDKLYYHELKHEIEDNNFLYSVLHSVCDEKITVELVRDENLLSLIVSLFENWQPENCENYNPGWVYSSEGDEARSLIDFLLYKDGLIKRFDAIRELVSIPEYLQNLTFVQELNLGRSINEKPSSEYWEAVEKMAEIENSMNVNSIGRLLLKDKNSE